MARAFQAGDAVRQKLGDQRELRVERYDSAGMVVCSFWSGVSRQERAFFEASLDKIPPESPPDTTAGP